MCYSSSVRPMIPGSRIFQNKVVFKVLMKVLEERDFCQCKSTYEIVEGDLHHGKRRLEANNKPLTECMKSSRFLVDLIPGLGTWQVSGISSRMLLSLVSGDLLSPAFPLKLLCVLQEEKEKGCCELLSEQLLGIVLLVEEGSSK